MGYYCHDLLNDPLAIVALGVNMAELIEATAKRANGSVAHIFVQLGWTGEQLLIELPPIVKQAAKTHPNLRFIIMTNTAEDDLLFRRAGLDSIWCNHNAFLDGRMYLPDAKAQKVYDAVYVGRLVDWKRHHLAVEVPRVAVITRDYDVNNDSAAAIVSQYHDLKFVNYDGERGVKELSPIEVRSVVTSARCGLALSKEEGANFASAEYLLCGLPVVTTASKGGRHVFFHPDYVEEVEETPAAVAAGVARLIERNLDPFIIRARTQQLFMDHRRRLITRLCGLAQTDLFQRATASLWLPQFINKLERWVQTD